MKQVFLIATVVAALLSNRVSAQDAALKAGEKASITFFDFTFSPSYFGASSTKVEPDAPNDLENRTLFQILRQLEANINEHYGVTLEPAKYDPTEEAKFAGVKCYPRIKKKDALKLGYDKIIEVRATMVPAASAAGAFSPVSAPKPLVTLNLKVFNKEGKEIFDTSAKAKGDEGKLAIGGISAGGYAGATILGLYKQALSSLFTKAEKKK